MIPYLLVFAGGGLGSICRYGIARYLENHDLTFPLATFIANAISCIILGVLIGMNLKETMHAHYRFLLMTGFCGGFSTFSTFSGETLLLIQSGSFFHAFSNIGLSLLVCLFCIYLGLKLVY